MTLGKRISRLRARVFQTRAKARDEDHDREASEDEPPKERGGRTAAGDARRASNVIAAVVVEFAKLARDMLAIPAQLFMTVAEFAGGAVLVAWRRALWPVAVALWRLAGAAYRLAAREVTPARAVFAVALAAAVSLGASQWLDYRGISIGTDAYAGELGIVAPPPEIDRVQAGDAHSWVMVPLAVGALVALVVAVAGRPRVARLLIVAGAAAIAIAVLVDVPKGLDEGTAAVAYQGASAHLLEGFWLQIAAAATLIACGLLMSRFLRAEAASNLQPDSTAPLRRLGRRAAGLARGWAVKGPRLPRRLGDAARRGARAAGSGGRPRKPRGGGGGEIEGARP